MPSPLASPAPPGFLSPAAFPSPGGPYPLPNDAPPAAPVPQYIGSAGGVANAATITVPVQNPTNPGDAIVAGLAYRSTQSPVLSCTDTQGNAYSLVQTQTAIQPFIAIYVAQNAAPLTAADSITFTLSAVAASSKQAMAMRVPAGSVVTPPGSSWLTYGTGSSATSTQGNITVKAPATVTTGGPLMIVAFGASASAAGGIQFPQNWNVAGSRPPGVNNLDWFAAAWLPAPSGIAANSTISPVQAPVAGQNLTAAYAPLFIETRIAPNRAPDMPPGMQSPGAWQYAPLSPPEGPWSTKYRSSPYKFTETLPAAPASHAAMTRSTGKQAPATPHTAGTLAKGARKGLAAAPHATGKLAKSAARILAATPHTAGTLTRAAGKTLAATPHTAAALAKSAGKTLAAAGHPLSALVAARARTLAATVHPAGKLARNTGKHLAATPHTAAAILRNRAMVLAARVTAAARLLTSVPVPVFKLGLPGTEWSVSISTIGISQLATQYVLIPVTATKAGAPYNPTTRTVQFAFMPSVTQVPGSSDWVAGSWETDTSNLLYPYLAQCLVGPSGSINPGIGTYVMYIRISDNPEVPILIAGQLQIQ